MLNYFKSEVLIVTDHKMKEKEFQMLNYSLDNVFLSLDFSQVSYRVFIIITIPNNLSL